MNANTRHLIMLFTLAGMWAPSFLFIKIGLQGFEPITLGFFRLLLSAVLMYGILRWNRLSLPSTWKEWKYIAAMGLTANAIPFVLFPFGEQYAESGAASVINGTTPIFTAIFAHLFIANERMNARRIGGIAVGFAGIVVMFLPSFLKKEFQHDSPWGLAAFGVAALLYGLAGIIAKKKLTVFPPLVVSTGQFVSASAMLLPVSFIVESPLSSRPTFAATASVAFLAVVGTVAAYILYYRFIATANITFVALTTFLMPPLGLILGIIFLKEHPSMFSFLGCALILASVFILNRTGDVVKQFFRKQTANTYAVVVHSVNDTE